MKFEDVLTEYKNIYENILSGIYPAKNSTGFPERNLSVNFSKAYEKKARQNKEEAYTWFEFQFGSKNNKHLDAVIINDKAKNVIFIESKRYSNPKNKKAYIIKDIQRIYDFLPEFQKRIHKSGYTYYGIILADVWNEDSSKEEILNFYIKHKNATKQDVIGFLKTDAESLSYLPDTIHLDAKNVNIPGNKSYNLVSMWWQIPPKKS